MSDVVAMEGQGMDAETLRKLAEIFKEEAERNSKVVDRQCNILHRLSNRMFELVEAAEAAPGGFQVGDQVRVLGILDAGRRRPVERGTEGVIVAIHGLDDIEVEFDNHPASWGVHVSEIVKVAEE